MKTAYPQFQGTTQIVLYSNIPFDNTYQHHCIISELFKNNSVDIYADTTHSKGLAKERFINRKNTSNNFVYPRYNLSGEYNFDYSNGLICSVVLELTPEQTNANYMRVESHNNNGSEYYYYFITGISQVNADTYRLSLELDVLMTYQDEFLSGVKDFPIMTNRKHCHRYADSGLMPFSADLKTGEDTFSNVKPSVIDKIYNLKHTEDELHLIRNVVWLYLCVDTTGLNFEDFPDLADDITFTCNGIQYPFLMLALPLNRGLTIKDSVGTEFYSWSADTIRNTIVRFLINNGSVHGSKISPYPPFELAENLSISGDTIVIQAYSNETIETTALLSMMSFKINTSDRFIALRPEGGYSPSTKDIVSLMIGGAFMISELTLIGYSMADTNDDFKDIFSNTYAPTINSTRYNDPKLLFAPFKKYVLTAQYCSDGCELYPELLFSEKVTSKGTNYFNFITQTTPYIGDNNIYTWLLPVSKGDGVNYIFGYYDKNRIGLSGSMNYSLPVGENALDVFNATQQQSFYQSKVASGITSGLTIAGGAGSVALGVAGLVGTLGMSSVASAGLIAGGVSAVAGGIASMTNTIKSTNAKIEDLKNTPDSINVAGSNFLSDYLIVGRTTQLPYISVYNVTDIIKKQANDFFYNYGYQVGRECYFNNDLLYTPTTGTTDDNIFGRTIFNYIQLNEDITNKINANIPIIIKQKLSNILNKGITLWSFFGNTSLWGVNDIPDNTINPDKWFLKCELDNTEY